MFRSTTWGPVGERPAWKGVCFVLNIPSGTQRLGRDFCHRDRLGRGGCSEEGTGRVCEQGWGLHSPPNYHCLLPALQEYC